MPPHSHNEPDESLATVPYVQQGLDTDRRRNGIQATAAAGGALIGGCIGPALVDEGQIPAALLGAFLGLAIGTFVSGFAFMLRPPDEVPVQKAKMECARIRRKLIRAVVIFVISLCAGPWVIGVFGHNGHPIAVLVCFAWIFVTVGACAYGKGFAVEWQSLRSSMERADHEFKR